VPTYVANPDDICQDPDLTFEKVRIWILTIIHFLSSFSGFFGEKYVLKSIVAELHHFYAALAQGKNFDAAPAPILLYSKTKFLKRTKV
jgi:hypothetical protein